MAACRRFEIATLMLPALIMIILISTAPAYANSLAEMVEQGWQMSDDITLADVVGAEGSQTSTQSGPANLVELWDSIRDVVKEGQEAGRAPADAGSGSAFMEGVDPDGCNSLPETEIKIAGYWQEGGKILRIEQEGSSVKGYFAKTLDGLNKQRCREPGSLYFKGTLSGAEFTGKMYVCNPRICSDAGLMPEARDEPTDFKFTVWFSENGEGRIYDCQRLTGTWTKNIIQYKTKGGKVVSCTDSQETKEISDFAATRVSSCEALEKELEFQKVALEVYEKWHAAFQSGLYRMSGYGEAAMVVDAGGNQVADSFDALQELIFQEIKSRFSGGAGEVSGYTRERISRNECWCKTYCNKCNDPLLLQMCCGHEAKHCQEIDALCRKIQSAPEEREAAVYYAWENDFPASLAQEISHYKWGIGILETLVQSGSCFKEGR